MTTRHRLLIHFIGLVLLAGLCSNASAADRPNIVFILADDLGYGDLGCYGQKLISTPRLDRMAEDGMLFTDFYAGSTVCAPSRCVLMTGKHLGHCSVRGNGSKERQALLPDEITVAALLQQQGYVTGMFGKWGLGEEDTPGAPPLKGFDTFFGYLSQLHAHNYYPEYLWSMEAGVAEKVKLRNVLRRDGKRYEEIGAGLATTKIDYSHDVIFERALEFVDKNRERPFFLYLPFTIPHANNEAGRLSGNGQEVPEFGIYEDRDWSDPDKGQAAMITRMDRDIGRLLDRLEKHGIADRTIVLFSSDNGHHDEGGHSTELFDPNGPLRGKKRDLYEGGIRVPLLVRWPGRVRPGSRSRHVAYFGDFLATAAELSGAEIPDGLDSISFLPTLLDHVAEQKQHGYLYWEFLEQGTKQAVRMGKWKAVRRPMLTGPIELFNLEDDLGETRDLAGEHPELIESMKKFMTEAHVDNERWPVR